MQPPVERIDVSTEELQTLLEQARPSLSPEGYEKLRAAIRTLGYVTELLEKQGTTLAALRELLCPASTEKTAKVLQQAGIETEKKPKSKGTSRLGKSGLIFWDTASGRIVFGRMVTSISGRVRRRRAIPSCGRKWETCWCARTWTDR